MAKGIIVYVYSLVKEVIIMTEWNDRKIPYKIMDCYSLARYEGEVSMDIRNLLNREEYNFIHTNPRLGQNIILLGLGGSYSYGTNNDNSDLDIRGITMNLKSDLLGLTDFEQYVDDKTDTVIYSFK